MKKVIFALIFLLSIASAVEAQQVFYSSSQSQPKVSPFVLMDFKLSGLYENIYLSFQTGNPELIDSIIVLSSADTTVFNPVTDGNDYWKKYSQVSVYDTYRDTNISVILGADLPNDGMLKKMFKVLDACVIRIAVIVYSNGAAVIEHSLKARK